MEEVFTPEAAVKLGQWKEVFTDLFSGEAVYRIEFALDITFLGASEYELDLGMVEYTADVKINGIPAGIAAFQPYKVRFRGDLLEEKNRIEINVANTACNRTVTADVYSYFTQKEIGPYHEKEVAYESETLGGGLIGPVILKKLI